MPMLQDLDKTLETFLRCELPQDIVRQVSFSFDTPDKEFITKLPAFNLFLYDLQENLELRSSVSAIRRQSNGTALKQRATPRMNCSYLITVWTSKTSDPPEEHRLLGEVMKVLLRHPKLPLEVLEGSFKGQEPPLRAALMRTNQLQSLGEFWQALGGKPKVALNYTVTISVPVHTAAEVVPLVMDSRI